MLSRYSSRGPPINNQSGAMACAYGYPSLAEWGYLQGPTFLLALRSRIARLTHFRVALGLETGATLLEWLLSMPLRPW